MKHKIQLKRYQTAVLITWALAAAILAAGHVLVGAPLLGTLSQVRLQYQESKEQAEHACMTAIPESRDRLLEQGENTQHLIERFSTAQNTPTGVVFEIGQIANGLGLKEFSSKNRAGDAHPTTASCKSLSEVWLTVEFQSSYEQFIRFMNELERNEPVIFVEKLNFRRTAQGSGDHDIKMDLCYLEQTQKTAGALARAE